LAEQPEQQQYDRWSRPPALSRRGYVLAVLVPVLLAAGGFGLLAVIDHTEGTPSGSAVRVPTSDWIPGQVGGGTPIQGTLSADQRHCVYLETADRQQIWPIWPAGYTAKVDEQGRVSVYDGKDHLVARDGQEVQTSGSYTGAAAYAGEPCLPAGDEVAVIQATVTALE
jgi:hypothetical protein